MPRTCMNLRPLAALALASAVLAGCGGDDESPVMAEDDREVPASAVASPAAFSRYVGTLQPDDRAAPLTIADGLRPPASEDEEPLALP